MTAKFILPTTTVKAGKEEELKKHGFWAIIALALLAGCPTDNTLKPDSRAGAEAGVDTGISTDTGPRVDVAAWPDSAAGPDMGEDAGAPQDLAKDTVSPYDLSCTSMEVEAEDKTKVLQQGWGVVSGKILHGGSGLETATAGAKLELAFKGTDLVVFYEKGPNRGEFSVTVDKGTPVKVNTKDTTFTFQNPVVVAKGLADANHKAVLECLVKYCSVDYFRIHTCK